MHIPRLYACCSKDELPPSVLFELFHVRHLSFVRILSLFIQAKNDSLNCYYIFVHILMACIVYVMTIRSSRKTKILNNKILLLLLINKVFSRFTRWGK